MTMRLQVGRTGVDQVTFGCSPAHEALRSLHVLSDVKHHPLHISWVLRTRARMPAELKSEVERYAFWHLDRPLVFRDIWPLDSIGTWAGDLAALREVPVERFAEQLIHGALLRNGLGRRVPPDAFARSAELREQAIGQVEARHPPSRPVLDELIADPEGCRERFAAFLSSYWEACIEPDWPGLHQQLSDDVARRGRALSRRGLLRMLAELSPLIRIDEHSDEAVIRRPARRNDTAQIDLTLTERDQILLAPSHFVWPELTAVVQKQRTPDGEQSTVIVVYALAEMQKQGRPPVPPDDLLKLLRSAGDQTRLQVLQLLAHQPRSTREIAGLIGLTEAAISKHLKLLQDAGWVATERHSYYVYYRLVRESVTDLSHALGQMLG